MNEPTNRAQIIGAAKQSLENSGIEYWCEREALPLDAAIDAIDAARRAADDEWWADAVTTAMLENAPEFRRKLEKVLGEQMNGSVLADEIDAQFEWALIEALDELPTGIKRETVARDHAKRYRDVDCEAREAGL